MQTPHNDGTNNSPAASSAAVNSLTPAQQLATSLLTRIDGLLEELAVWHNAPSGTVADALEFLDTEALRELPRLSGAVQTWEAAGVFGAAVFGPEAAPYDLAEEDLTNRGSELYEILQVARVAAVATGGTNTDQATNTLFQAFALAAHRRLQPALASQKARHRAAKGSQ